MGILDLFSKRQKRLRGETPDVYQYDEVPRALRVQLTQIIRDGIGPTGNWHNKENALYEFIHQAICREYGVYMLIPGRQFSDWEHVANYMLQAEDVEHVIDTVELCVRTIDTIVREEGRYEYRHAKSTPDEVISEVNARFKEHGVGFEYTSGTMIRVDSQTLHSEVVKPVLTFLLQKQYSGANDEFLKAHQHYRQGRYKECLADCLKAFESVMKSICDKQRWQYAPTDTAKSLIDVCMTNGLFPSFMQSHLGSLRSILESGVPTVRNRLGGHGQGSEITNVSEATARFTLHLTATNILFFVESAEDLT